MNKRVIIQALLTFSAIFCFGQVNYINSAIPDSKLSTSCQNPKENKTIGICQIKTDTLEFDHLKECNKITISDDTKGVISSYNFGYSPDGSTYVESFVGSNQIPQHLISSIGNNQIKKITLSNIRGDDGTENSDLGYRFFYIKF